MYVIKGENRHRCQGIACKTIPCPNMSAITVEDVLEVVKGF